MHKEEISDLLIKLSKKMESKREGVIIEWPQKRIFYERRDIIITSRTDVREMVDQDLESTLWTQK